MNRFFNAKRRRRRVLVVDDEPINRELLEAILSLNYDVDTATDGKEAQEMLYASKESYSLILLDLLMPNMSGFQLLELCKSDDRLKDIPIIVMTSEKSAEVRSIRMGADDFISKPYRMPEVIIARCERIIELSEEKKLIRSIEKDKVTGLYIKVFFDAYIRRSAPDIRRPMDAVELRLVGTNEKTPEDFVLKKTAEIITDSLANNSGIACYMGNGNFRALCERGKDHEALLRHIKDEFSGDGITAAIGVYSVPDVNGDTDDWFEKAGLACDKALNGAVAYYGV